MDWVAVIERNRRALTRVLAGLFAMAARDTPVQAGDQPSIPTLPRRLHRAVLRLLRPAESAMRRLVIVAARGIVVPPPLLRPPKPKAGSSVLRGRGGGTGVLLPRGFRPPDDPAGTAPRATGLPLFDPLRRISRRRRGPAAGVPRISLPGLTVPFPVTPRRACAPDDPLDATRLLLRLDALGRALDDLPAHALRFARWRSRSHAVRALERGKAAIGAAAAPRRGGATRFRRVWPLRAGRPPGSCRRYAHEIHEILHDLHGLAFDVLEAPDTS